MTGPGRMQVRELPNGKFVLVFDNMLEITGNPERRADLERARERLSNTGAAAVLYFDFPVDVT